MYTFVVELRCKAYAYLQFSATGCLIMKNPLLTVWHHFFMWMNSKYIETGEGTHIYCISFWCFSTRILSRYLCRRTRKTLFCYLLYMIIDFYSKFVLSSVYIVAKQENQQQKNRPEIRTRDWRSTGSDSDNLLLDLLVAHLVLCPPPPLVVSLPEGLPLLGDDQVHHHRGPTGQGRLCALQEGRYNFR